MIDDETMAAMYANEDEDEAARARPLFAKGGGMMHRIVVDGIGHDVPTLAYVQSLERMVRDQAARIDDLEKLIGKVRSSVNHQRHVVSNLGRERNE